VAGGLQLEGPGGSAAGVDLRIPNQAITRRPAEAALRSEVDRSNALVPRRSAPAPGDIASLDATRSKKTGLKAFISSYRLSVGAGLFARIEPMTGEHIRGDDQASRLDIADPLGVGIDGRHVSWFPARGTQGRGSRAGRRRP
jgi:hypothetical protein